MTELKNASTIALLHKAGEAFYLWEDSTYGVDSTLSDDDRVLWMQGFIYACKQMRETKND